MSAAAAFTFVALLLAPLAGWFYFGFDLSRVELPMLCAIKERLASGEGLWLSPLLENGGPLLARPDAQLLYPPRWVALALPVEWAVAWGIAFHLAVAAAATAWLARTFGARPLTAAAMGVTFAFCGTSLDLIRHAHYLTAAAWLPLCWAGARRAMESRGQARDLLATGGGLAGCLLGAEPQAFVIGALLILVEGVLRARAGLPALRRVLNVWLAGASAVAVGMSQWWLTLGELELTRRGGSLAASEALTWPFSPPLWLGTVLQGVPLDPVQPLTNVWQIWNQSIAVANPWNAGPYLGALFVAATVAGLPLRRPRLAVVVFAVGLAFALGEYLGVLPALMRVVPGLTSFRYPSKYLLVTFLAATVVAGLAFDRLSRPRVRRRVFFAAGLVLGAGLLGGIVWTFIDSNALNAAADAMRPLNHRPNRPDLPLLADALRGAMVQGLLPLLLAMGMLAMSQRWRPFLPLLAAFDVLAASPHQLLIGQPLAELSSPLAALRGRENVLCVHPDVASGIFNLGGHVEWDQTLWLRMNLVPELQACEGVSSAISYTPLESAMSARLLDGIRAGRGWAFGAMGCTHAVVDASIPGLGHERVLSMAVPQVPELSSARLGIRLVKLDRSLPQVFVAQSPVLHDSEAAALAALSHAQTIEEIEGVIEDPLGRLAAGTILPIGDGAEPPGVEWLGAGHARVDIGGSGAALVGLRTAFLAGWTARQRGRDLPVLRATGNHVATLAEAGAGPIELEYRPRNLRASVATALGGVLMGLLVLTLTRRRSRAAATPAQPPAPPPATAGSP